MKHQDIDHTGLTGIGGTTTLAHNEFTASVNCTATTEGAANTIVTATGVVFDGSTAVMVEFFASLARPPTTAGALLQFALYDGASSIGVFGVTATGTTQAEYQTVLLRRRLTPTAATHTYSVRGFVSTGTGVVGAGAGGSGTNIPGYIRITRA